MANDYSRNSIAEGQQVTLAELRDIVKAYEAEQAYGSETYGLTLWCEWSKGKNDSDVIPADDVLWWYDYYDTQAVLADLLDEDRGEVQGLLDSGEPASALGCAEKHLDRYAN